MESTRAGAGGALDLRLQSPSHSLADPALTEQNERALRPVRDFVNHVLLLADDWLSSWPASPGHAAAALEALDAWARAGALLGPVNRQGEYEREWTLGSLALAYLKIEQAPGLDSDRERRVREWFSASQERALFAWGLARGRIGIAQVDARGFLPLELARRRLALHYHVFALAPLVMLAELADANGVKLYAEGDRAIQRLAGRVIEGLSHPENFAELAGAEQSVELPPHGPTLAWAEAYYARFRDPRLEPWLRAARPLRDVRLGGDMTAAFGVLAPE